MQLAHGVNVAFAFESVDNYAPFVGVAAIVAAAVYANRVSVLVEGEIVAGVCVEFELVCSCAVASEKYVRSGYRCALDAVGIRHAAAVTEEPGVEREHNGDRESHMDKPVFPILFECLEAEIEHNIENHEYNSAQKHGCYARYKILLVGDLRKIKINGDDSRACGNREHGGQQKV